jgi:uncharacterized protein YaiI (UPF0178 family)
MLDLYADINAKPVLPQLLRAAERYGLELYLVTADFLYADTNVHLILAQDDQVKPGSWIAANILRDDICITADFRLAEACILRGAEALSPDGRLWDANALDEGTIRSAPNPRGFAQRLEAAIVSTRAINRFALTSWPDLPPTRRDAPMHRLPMPRAALG